MSLVIKDYYITNIYIQKYIYILICMDCIYILFYKYKNNEKRFFLDSFKQIFLRVKK